jgi:hypothetical protein
MFRKICFSAILLLIIPLFMGAILPASLYVTSDIYGPFTIKQNDINITVSVTWDNTSTNAYEFIECGATADNITYSEQLSRHLVTKNEKYTFTFTLPLKSLLTRNGMYIKVGILNSNGTYKFKYETMLYPAYPNTYNPFDFVHSPLVLDNTLLTIRNNTSLLNLAEQFSFNNYLSYFNANVYHSLDLNQFSFTYKFLKDFKFESASLYFYDTNNIFPNMHSSNDEKVILNLDLICNYQTISMSFADKLYVNPQNLDMSLTPLIGYKETNYFFLPINMKEQISFIDFKFDLVNVGSCYTDFFFTVSYLTDVNLIGECNESEYCVVGGIK